jgi:acetyl esterase
MNGNTNGKSLLHIAGWILGALVGLAVSGYAVYQLSPWPRALLIRRVFTNDGVAKNAAIAGLVPAGVSTLRERQYASGDGDAKLDVYYPSSVEGSAKALPTIVWVHGGAWLAGDKSELSNYLKILASYGFTVVGVNYSLAPGATFPRPVVQLGEALRYLQDNAQELHVDPSRILIAGDSAGAQIASQYGLIVSNSEYAAKIGIKSELERRQLKGLILSCGPYDAGAVNMSGAFGEFLNIVMWSYSGTRNFATDPKFALLSTKNFVTSTYPPVFITGGNGDPLTAQSKALADKLSRLGVKVDTLFFPDNYEPKLPHEYQLVLDNPAGKLALDRIVSFARTQTAQVR